MNKQPSFRDFSIFSRRLILQGRLRTETALRIGSGEADDLHGTDIAVMKDVHRHPFIPGSSFKGALRAHVERLVRSLWPLEDTRFAACDPLAERSRCIPGNWSSAPTRPSNVKTIEELRLEAQQMNNPTNDLTDLIWAQSCLVCRLFGSPWMASKVLIKDLKLTHPELWVEARYQVRTGVGIDRDSEIAAQAILYSGETVASGTEFDWEIIVDNADPQAEEPLLFLGLQEMIKGRIPLGGARSRGLGSISLIVDRTELIDGSGSASLLNYLTTQQATPQVWDELMKTIPACVRAIAKGPGGFNA